MPVILNDGIIVPMNAIKMIALDMDGTLLKEHGEVSEEGKKVLKQLREKGILIVIASGRPFYSIQRILSSEYFDYAACLNGQIITDNHGTVLSSKADLSKEDIQFLSKYLYRYPMIMSYSLNNTFYHTCSPQFHFLSFFYQRARRIYHFIKKKPFYPLTTVPLSKVQMESCEKLCFASKADILKKFVRQLPEDAYSVFFVSPTWLEIQTKGISKGNALQEIASMNHIDLQNTAAIGDGENDISMIRIAYKGVAMGNAMESVRKCADEAALDNAHDGAVVWMKENLLN